MHSSTYTTPVERLEASSEAWLRDLEAQGCSPRTITGYALTVRDFIEYFAAEEDNPSAPSYADILLWAQTFDARGLTQRTRQQYLVRLRAFFTWACEHGWYQVNPVLKRLLPSPSDLPPKEYAKLGKWQLQRVYTFDRPDYARNATYPRNYAIVILLLTTDLRNNELLHLTPAALRWSDNQIFVSCGNSCSVRRWLSRNSHNPPCGSISPAASARKIYPIPRRYSAPPAKRAFSAQGSGTAHGLSALRNGFPPSSCAMSRPSPASAACAART